MVKLNINDSKRVLKINKKKAHQKKKPKKFVSIGTKIPDDLKEKIDKIAKNGETTTSKIIRELLENMAIEYDNGTIFFCDICKKGIPPKTRYYTEVSNIETYTGNPKEFEIEVSDSVETEILCMDCAKKTKKLKLFKE